ncbi:hypothetical protein [Aestuariimicrobium ganziense]|uniref:hypothetical protein n=1 Tax=Aestuariimicrobium ganziense TaxID=2773677 RepID=UPI0019433923|nr:hypothetical protein [Aestuariimicrobium ganziense]
METLPDGSFKLITHREAVRAKKNGVWAPIETTLVSDSSRVRPGNAAVDLSFSAGGSQPLLSISDHNQTVTMTWPGALPEPTLDGSSATYHDVRPDVDLMLTAHPEGYSQVLIVHTPEAATELVADPVTLSLTTTGGSLSQTSDDTISATSSKGTRLAGHSPVMWDSATADPDQTTPSATDPGESPLEPVALELTPATTTQSAITINPSSDLISAADTVYPIYIDPGMSKSRLNFATVHSLGWNYYNDSTQPMRVGRCGWSECNNSTQGVARSYFSLDISALPDNATVYTAAVYVNQIHSASSIATPVSLTKAGAFGSGVAWPGPTSTSLESITDIAGFNTNPAKVLEFDSTPVRDYVAQNKASNTINFGLKAPDEGDAWQWKKFANNPSLEVTFNTPPSAPSAFGISATQGVLVDCRAQGQTLYTTDATPNFAAKSSNTSSNNIGMWFEVWNANATSLVVKNPTAVQGQDNQSIAWTTNSSNTTRTAPLGPGAHRARVRAESVSSDTPGMLSGWSTWLDFTVDTTPPTLSSTPIRSYHYPPNFWGSPQNQPGSFQLSSSGDTAAFSYAWDNLTPPTPTTTTCTYTGTGYIPATSGKATLTAPTDLQPGHHTLSVKAFDHAHNMTSTVTYSFYVSPTIADNNTTNLYEAEAQQVNSPDGAYNYDEAGHTMSGGTQSHLIGQGPHTFTITTPVDGYYAIGMHWSKANHFGVIRLKLNNGDYLRNPNNDEIIELDGYTSVTGERSYVQIGGYRLKQGTHHITVDIVGKNPAAGSRTYTQIPDVPDGTTDNGYAIGIDYFTIAPLKLHTATTLTASFNNNGIGQDGTTAANFDGAGNSYSQAALEAQNITTTNTDVWQITNPTSPLDNTIAYGQDITLNIDPAPEGQQRYINVLVGSCQPISATNTRQFTINYTNPDDPNDPLRTDKPIPNIKSWTDLPTGLNTTAPPPTPGFDEPATIVAARTTSHRLTQSAPDNTQPVNLYHLRIPVEPNNYGNLHIQSLTLPNIGTIETNTTQCTNALHIFNITTTTTPLE